MARLQHAEKLGEIFRRIDEERDHMQMAVNAVEERMHSYHDEPQSDPIDDALRLFMMNKSNGLDVVAIAFKTMPYGPFIEFIDVFCRAGFFNESAKIEMANCLWDWTNKNWERINGYDQQVRSRSPSEPEVERRERRIETGESSGETRTEERKEARTPEGDLT